jgi:hypothetical protein
VQPDLFVVLEAIHDWPVKDDVSSMEYPIFSLSKNRDTRIRVYSRAGRSIRIIPSAVGAATVFGVYALISENSDDRPFSPRPGPVGIVAERSTAIRSCQRTL